MFQLLTGEPVHPSRTDNELLVTAATRPARSLAELRPDLEPWLVAVVDRALSFERSRRWPTRAPCGPRWPSRPGAPATILPPRRARCSPATKPLQKWSCPTRVPLRAEACAVRSVGWSGSGCSRWAARRCSCCNTAQPSCPCHPQRARCRSHPSAPALRMRRCSKTRARTALSVDRAAAAPAQCQGARARSDTTRQERRQAAREFDQEQPFVARLGSRQ